MVHTNTRRGGSPLRHTNFAIIGRRRTAHSVVTGLDVVTAHTHRIAIVSQIKRDMSTRPSLEVVASDRPALGRCNDVGASSDTWLTIQDLSSDLRKRVSYPATICSCVNSRSTFFRPSIPKRRAASGLSNNQQILPASSLGSPGSTSRPVTPSSMISGNPPQLLAIIGSSFPLASTATIPNDSLKLGITQISRPL